MCTHLQRRGGRYYLRRAVPQDLRARYGKREITRALGTSDRQTAAVLCRRLGLELDDEFRLARAQKPVLFRSVLPGPLLPVEPTQQPVQPPVQAPQHAVAPLSAPTPPPDTKKPPEVIEEAVDTTLNDLADKWERERQPDWKSIAATRRTVRRFTEMVGDLLPRSITRAHVVAFKDELLASGQTTVNTNKYLTVLNVLLNFGVANGELEYNPAQGVKIRVKRDAKDARHPFALRDLQTIFSTLSPYSGRPAPEHIGHDAAYWIPLLALFYGARREELCQLHPEDIYEEVYVDEAGTDRKAWVLRITDSGEGQKVKNIGSVRRVPIHEDLIARGFLAFVQAQRGKARLFSGLTPDPDGIVGSAFGKWFNRSLRTVCGITDPKLVFHSFRHAFKDHCRALLIPEEVSDALSGHASGKVSRRYGGLAFPLHPLVEAMQKYRVPGLVLPDCRDALP